MKPKAVEPGGKRGQNTRHRLGPPGNKHIMENNKVSVTKNVHCMNIRSSVKNALFI